MAKEKEINFKKVKVSHRDKLSTEDLITLTLSENIDAYALLLYKKNQELQDLNIHNLILSHSFSSEANKQTAKKKAAKAKSTLDLIEKVEEHLKKIMGRKYAGFAKKAKNMAQKLPDIIKKDHDRDQQQLFTDAKNFLMQEAKTLIMCKQELHKLSLNINKEVLSALRPFVKEYRQTHGITFPSYLDDGNEDEGASIQ